MPRGKDPTDHGAVVRRRGRADRPVLVHDAPALLRHLPLPDDDACRDLAAAALRLALAAGVTLVALGAAVMALVLVRHEDVLAASAVLLLLMAGGMAAPAALAARRLSAGRPSRPAHKPALTVAGR